MTASPRVPVALLVGIGVAAAALGLARAADPAGDAARGRLLFEAKGCARCHIPRGLLPGIGPPLDVVRRPQGVIELAGRLWNHAPGMAALFEREGLAWPELGREQIADLVAYLQADPVRDPGADPRRGQVVLVAKGCLKCHRLRGEGGAVATELTGYRARYESPVGWATTVWNHSPRMARLAAAMGILYPRFTGDEMANLVEFLRGATAGSPR
ncbi:MAG: c-type cytochrome [Candidatus Rokubacteria bacterium]|nr:c-type cytochrome [Candidatus Rokubacteria bacterium]